MIFLKNDTNNLEDLLHCIKEDYDTQSNKLLTNLHISNDKIIGFYRTMYVQYKDSYNKNIPYLFPISIELKNKKINITMTFGSVEKDFIIPSNINGTGFGTELITVGVGETHLYKLLVATYTHSHQDSYISLKSFICIIEALEEMQFPFMRITSNEALKKVKY